MDAALLAFDKARIKLYVIQCRVAGQYGYAISLKILDGEIAEDENMGNRVGESISIW